MRAHHGIIPAGPGNQRVRQYVALRRHRTARSTPHAAIEGLGLLEAALSHGARVETLLVCTELVRSERATHLVDRLVALGVPSFSVTPRTFRQLSDRDGPDGLAAVASLDPVDLHDVHPDATSLVLVLDRFEHPGNVGSLIRCADAAGATAVVVSDGRVRINHPLVVKASAGAVFSVRVSTTPESEVQAWLREQRFQLIAADPGGDISYRAASYGGRVAVILGSERHGLSAAWRRAADRLVAIPMAGRVDSLNAGHAGALILFEVAHQHGTGALGAP